MNCFQCNKEITICKKILKRKLWDPGFCSYECCRQYKRKEFKEDRDYINNYPRIFTRRFLIAWICIYLIISLIIFGFLYLIGFI